MAERVVIWQRGLSFAKIGREGGHLQKYGSGSPKSKHDINNKQDAQKTKSNKNPSDIEKEKDPSNKKI